MAARKQGESGQLGTIHGLVADIIETDEMKPKPRKALFDVVIGTATALFDRGNNIERLAEAARQTTGAALVVDCSKHLRRVLPYKDPAWFEKFAGGPVGVSSLAVAVGDEAPVAEHERIPRILQLDVAPHGIAARVVLDAALAVPANVIWLDIQDPAEEDTDLLRDVFGFQVPGGMVSGEGFRALPPAAVDVGI